MISAPDPVFERYPWHQTLLDKLAQQKQANRLAAAYLLPLRSGQFDTTLLTALKRLLLCQAHCWTFLNQSPNESPCRYCQLIDQETHPNLWLLDIKSPQNSAGQTVGIDDIRALSPVVWQSAPLPSLKVIVLHHAEGLSLNAQNALLKLLEEPAEDTLFLLTSGDSARLLPTIHSRVQRLHYPKASNLQMCDYLSRLGYSPEQVDYAIQETDSPEAARTLLQSPEKQEKIQQQKKQFYAFFKQRITVSHFVASMDFENFQTEMAQYIRYLDKLARLTLNNAAHLQANPELAETLPPELNDLSQLKSLYFLRDCFIELRDLAKTACNLPLQAHATLNRWNHEYRTR